MHVTILPFDFLHMIPSYSHSFYSRMGTYNDTLHSLMNLKYENLILPMKQYLQNYHLIIIQNYQFLQIKQLYQVFYHFLD